MKRRRTRLIATLCVLSLLCANTAGAENTAQSTLSDRSNQTVSQYVSAGFTDVDANSWYYTSVQWAVSQGIAAGTTLTTFSPDSTCTTAQIITFLWRANGSPEPAISSPFQDVRPDSYAYRAAIWAFEHDLVDGTSFDGDTPCTRAAAVMYLWKLAGSPVTGSHAFSDVPERYAPAVSWAFEQAITAGSSATTFSPERICTRAHIVTFLYRASQAREQTESFALAQAEYPNIAPYPHQEQYFNENGSISLVNQLTYKAVSADWRNAIAVQTIAATSASSAAGRYGG